MKTTLRLRMRRPKRRIMAPSFRRLLAEKLEDRALLAGDCCADVFGAADSLAAEGEGPATPLVKYQVRLVPAGGALFMRDPVQTNVLIPTPDLTTVNVGDSYDLAVTVSKVEPGFGVYAGYLDIGYDSNKTRVRVGEVQNLRLSGLGGGSFSLTFDGETTTPITFSANPATLAASIQAALTSLPKIGEGNVNVRAALQGGNLTFMVRFVGKFHDQDTPNLTAQVVTGGSSAQVSVTYEGDLQGGITPVAFKEAFRSWGGATIAGVANGREFYPNDVSANSLPNLLNNVGAFSTADSPYPGQLTSVESAAGFLAAPPRELVRARMLATAAGTITFTPDVVNVPFPAHKTLVYADPGQDTWVRPEQIDSGAIKTLTVTAGTPILAAADSATVLQGSAANAIDVLSNDTTNPAGQAKAVVAVTQPASGAVTFTASGVVYTPPQNFVGQETFTYTARNMAAGAESMTSTATVTVTVASPITAVNDAATIMVHTFATTIDVLANDTTTPTGGQEKSIVSVTEPASGRVTVVNNKIVFEPADEFTGTTTFTYTARNTTAGATSQTSTATVTVTINPATNPATSALVQYQVRIVPAHGALFEPDPENPQALVPTPDLTSLSIGEVYDLAVTVKANDPESLGVFGGWLDLGYDSNLTQVQAGEIQQLVIGPFSSGNRTSSASGTFTLDFGGLTTEPIKYSASGTTLAARVKAALTALASVGEGNVDVRDSGSSSAEPMRLQVRFGGKFLGRDVPNTTVASQALTGPSNPTVAISYEGDLQGGSIPAVAFAEAFRSRGVPTITTVAEARVHYPNAVSAGNLPNLIDDMGAFTDSISANRPGELTSAEVAAGIAVAPPRELVRARFKATAAGVVTFQPDLTSILHPEHATLMFGVNGAISPLQIDVGVSKTLTILGGAPSYTAQPDTLSVREDSLAVSIDVLANDAAPSPGAIKQLVSVTDPLHGVVIQAGNGIQYKPAADFVGTDMFTYTARSSYADEFDLSMADTTTVMVTVTAVNDGPSFAKGPDQEANDESGLISVDGWAKEIAAGPANEAGQVLSFLVSASDTELFSVQPAIDSSGRLTYTPAMNAEGTAVVSVVLRDDGGTENDGSDTSETKSFEIRIIKLHEGHNAEEPLDVGDDGGIEANDALIAINYLNAFGGGEDAESVDPELGFLDVDADGIITAADPLEVINYLNAFGAMSSPPKNEENGEGESRGAADDLSTLFGLLAFDAVESTTRRRQRN